MTLPHLTLHLLIRWLDLLGVAVLIGGVAFRYLMVHPLPLGERGGVRAARWLDDWRLFGGAILLVGLTSLVDLGLRARMMSPTMEFWRLLPLVLQGSHVGHVWLFKAGCLLVLWGVAAGLWQGRSHAGAFPWAVSTLCAAAGLGLAQALSGHAADRGNVTVAVLADWLHVVTTAVWFGGLIWLRLFLPRFPVADPGDHSTGSLTAEVLRRFSRVATTCVGVLVATGLVNAFQQVATPAALVATPYGQVLIVKVVLVAGMVALGGLTRFYVIPGLTGRVGPFSSAVTRGVTAVMGQGRGSAPLVRRGLLLMGFECLIGLAVLWCAAILTQVPPPRAAMMLNPPHHH